MKLIELIFHQGFIALLNLRPWKRSVPSSFILIDDINPKDGLPHHYPSEEELSDAVKAQRRLAVFQAAIDEASLIEDDTKREAAWEAALMNYYEHVALTYREHKEGVIYPTRFIRMTKDEKELLNEEGLVSEVLQFQSPEEAKEHFGAVKARLAELRPHRSVTEKKQLNEALPQASAPSVKGRGGKRL